MKKWPDRKLPHMRFEITGNLYSGRPTRRVIEPWQYALGMSEGNALHLSIPEGFETDFASVPRALWWLYPPDGPWIEASVIHDYLYCSDVQCTRSFADSVFREIMIHMSIEYRKYTAMYAAVRAFGWAAYGSRTSRESPVRGQ